MRLSSVVIIAVVVIVCDGRGLRQGRGQMNKSPNVDRAPGTPPTAIPIPAPTPFNPCDGNYSCYQSQILETHYPHYIKKRVHGGKWLKIKKKPFDPQLPRFSYYTEMKDVFSAPNARYAIPIVLRIDNASLDAYNIYTPKIQKLRKTVYQATYAFAKGMNETRIKDRGHLQNLTNRFLNWKMFKEAESASAYINCTEGESVTVFNYLNPVYQDPSSATLDVSKNPNVTIANVQGFTTYVKGFFLNDLYGAPEIVQALAKSLNRTTLGTFYFVDYANDYYEIWLSTNQSKPDLL